VVLLGNTAVGKTSIFNRVINDTYIRDGVSNTSAYYRSKVMEVPGTDKKLKMHLWDTAG
jgi:small GTP-binding protein